MGAGDMKQKSKDQESGIRRGRRIIRRDGRGEVTQADKRAEHGRS